MPPIKLICVWKPPSLSTKDLSGLPIGSFEGSPWPPSTEADQKLEWECSCSNP
jgi:hypothetical protein